MEGWFKFCEEKTPTISVSNSASCDADSLKVIEVNIDTRKKKPCPKGNCTREGEYRADVEHRSMNNFHYYCKRSRHNLLIYYHIQD